MYKRQACIASLDQNHLVSSPIWSSDREHRFEVFRAVSQAGGLSAEAGLLAEVIANAQPIWIRDVANDPNFTRQAVARQAGIKSAFAFPVLSGSEVIAVLEFFAVERTDRDDALLKLSLIHI